jgi:hypothetical protein
MIAMQGIKEGLDACDVHSWLRPDRRFGGSMVRQLIRPPQWRGFDATPPSLPPAMPVIPMTTDEIEAWMTAPAKEGAHVPPDAPHNAPRRCVERRPKEDAWALSRSH